MIITKRLKQKFNLAHNSQGLQRHGGHKKLIVAQHPEISPLLTQIDQNNHLNVQDTHTHDKLYNMIRTMTIHLKRLCAGGEGRNGGSANSPQTNCVSYNVQRGSTQSWQLTDCGEKCGQNQHQQRQNQLWKLPE